MMMKFSLTVMILSATASLCSALDHPFMGRGRPDQRAPCPFLNTMANHDILNHNGTDITLDQLSNALKYAGLDDGAAKAFVSAVSKFSPEVAKNKKFDLDMLNAKHKGDHDVSLTRYDILTEFHQYGDNRPSVELVNGLLGVNPNNSELTYQDLILWRQSRHTQEKARHTDEEPVDYGVKTQFLSAGECSLLLNVFGKDGHLNKDYARSILINERLPETWTPNHGIGMMKIGGGILKCGLGYWLPQRLVRWLYSSGPSSESETETKGSSESSNEGAINAWKAYQRAFSGQSVEVESV